MGQKKYRKIIFQVEDPKRKYPPLKEPIYEQRVVLYMDILGFKDIISATEASDEHEKSQSVINLHDALKKIANMGGIYDNLQNRSSKQATQMSDAIVISVLKNEQNQVLFLIQTALNITTHLIEHGIICRGAITIGNLFHNDSLIFGPALVDAYISETTLAKYPRIIINDSVIEAAISSNKGLSASNLEIEKKRLMELLRRDVDDHLFIDYFNQAWKNRAASSLSDLNIYIDRLRAIINKGLKSHAKTKYEWMLEKFNQMIIHYQSNSMRTRLVCSDDLPFFDERDGVVLTERAEKFLGILYKQQPITKPRI